jgi:hypothetical protein
VIMAERSCVCVCVSRSNARRFEIPVGIVMPVMSDDS